MHSLHVIAKQGWKYFSWLLHVDTACLPFFLFYIQVPSFLSLIKPGREVGMLSQNPSALLKASSYSGYTAYTGEMGILLA